MLKILHVLPYFYLHEIPGGIEIHVYELVKYLAKQGFESTIYASTTKQLSSFIERENLAIRGINIQRFPAAEISTLPFSPKQVYPLPLSLFSEKIRRCDVVHLHGQEFLTSFIASLSAKRFRKPVVLTIHNSGQAFESDLRIRISRRLFYRTIFATTINRANTIIVPIKGEFPALRYLTHKNIVRIPHCVDLDRFDNLEKSPEYILYLGRLEPVKGVEYFVKAIPHVLEEVNTNFVIAGHGSMEVALKRLIYSKGIENHVKFIRGVSYENVPRLFAKASIFVAPGNAGLTLLEAAASNTPIVTADNTWNLSMLDEKSALIIREKNTKQLAEAIITLLRKGELAERLSCKARRFVEEKRSWNNVINQYTNLYKAVAKNDG